ncbi:MAG TPA: 2Fe-2S iron-sulfur cluster-binding protein [Candidatus Moranbacteria bacterium]|nr:2Fe-2S iron-sulfur cluster-binding protein [Candidatus Moranbacteria bacterium]
MEIKINGKKYKANEGDVILDVCRREGIRIPTLCNFPFEEGEFKKETICRLCLVEVNLTDKLVPSCAFPVCSSLEVTTESEKIKKAREINMELLWSDHAGKCVKCKKNRMCELQSLAEEYKIDNFHFIPRKEDLTNTEELDLLKDNKTRVVVEEENPAICRTTEFCIECRRCINVCPERKFGFNHRAGDVIVGTPYEKVLECSFCGECVRVCPVAALTDKNNFSEITEKLDDIKKIAVALVAEGMEEKIKKQLLIMGYQKEPREILKSLGFEKIFDFSEKDAQDEGLDDFKVQLSRKEKINMEDIILFYISSNISLKKEKIANLDYILSEREIARLARDKKII